MSFVFTQADIQRVFGWDDHDAVLSAPHQTIPSRTPTPRPTNVPAPNPTKTDGGDPATAVPTSTTEILPTHTATPPVTIAYTPVGGFVPTAESCGSPPTVLVQNPTNVRQGPGTNYLIVGRLVFLEVRFILGRAADAAWWFIQLDDGANGWVADNVVTVQGYTGGVPILPAPAINGQTPTPGAPWNPTPLPFCTVTPTATAVPSATPEPVTAAAESAAGTQPAAEAAATAVPAETAPPEPTQTAVAPPTLPPAAPTGQPELISSGQAADETEVEPIETAQSGSAADWLLPAAGLLLVAGGATAFFTRRKSS